MFALAMARFPLRRAPRASPRGGRIE